jgi:molybdenum ABC transporter molybdate-binding protein
VTVRIVLLTLLLLPLACHPEQATVATAANFRTTLETLIAEFERKTEHTLVVVSGSTGQLYAQVLNGAPFDVFLAADQDRPERLEVGPRAVAGSRITYAIGRLALIARDSTLIRDDAGDTLSQPEIGKLAIANPAVAPYGVASRQVLRALHLDDEHFGAIVLGENVAQVMTLVRTGNVDVGLVALAIAMFQSPAGEPPYLAVPADLHDPVRQDAVLLAHGEDNSAALAFMAFLESSAARGIIEAAGYGVE